MSPFRNILKLSVADMFAKALYFIAFIYMANRLGVFGYGVLEFAVAIRTYLVLAADGGLELWAIREAAKERDIRQLASRVIPLRILLAAAAYITINASFFFVPDNPNLRKMIPILALTVFLQAFNLKWVFMGLRSMSSVATGLILTQIVFSVLIFVFVRDLNDLFVVPVVWCASELVMVVYFGWMFALKHGGLRLSFTLRGTRPLVRPALALGVTQTLGLMNYNLGSLIIGLWLGPAAVGWYGAAYKPITAALAVPISYFIGLFPTLSTAYKTGRAGFVAMVHRSLRLTAIFAMPLGITGFLLGKPIIDLLFGAEYRASVGPFQILAWSAVLVILRNNFRHALTAAGRQRLDFYCALAAVGSNVALNALLIPLYRLEGAAIATVLSELIWFSMVLYFFRKHFGTVGLLASLLKPAAAAVSMALCLVVGQSIPWIPRLALSSAVYLGVLILLREPEVTKQLAWIRSVTLSDRPRLEGTPSAD